MSEPTDRGDDDDLRGDDPAPIPATTDTTDREDDDWDERELCPDETCIGTLDEHGRCGVCGAQGTPPPRRNPSTGAPASTLEPVSGTASPAALEPLAEPGDEGEEDEDDDWDERELCPDETCIGTLGADGRCGVCGRGA